MCNLNTLPRLECVALVRDRDGNLHRARGKYASFFDMWAALAARGLTIVKYMVTENSGTHMTVAEH